MFLSNDVWDVQIGTAQSKWYVFVLLIILLFASVDKIKKIRKMKTTNVVVKLKFEKEKKRTRNKTIFNFIDLKCL